MPARTLAIGDIHGCDVALAHLLERLNPAADDTVVLLGDVVDRGPATRQVIDRLIALRKSCQLIFIMGNHEEMMRDAISGSGLLHAWMETGGRETLDSYGGLIDDIPAPHIRFLMSTVPFYETQTEIFVHASLEPGISLKNQSADWLRWKHLGGSERRHESGKRIICGHTPQTDGVPLVLDGWVCLDTFAHGGKFLSALDLATDHVYQASERGEVREFPLGRYA